MSVVESQVPMAKEVLEVEQRQQRQQEEEEEEAPEPAMDADSDEEELDGKDQDDDVVLRVRRVPRESEMVRPCVHNQWMKQTKKRGKLVLKCIQWKTLWKTYPEFHTKCSAFHNGKCEKGAECEHPHVYARRDAKTKKSRDEPKAAPATAAAKAAAPAAAAPTPAQTAQTAPAATAAAPASSYFTTFEQQPVAQAQQQQPRPQHMPRYPAQTVAAPQAYGAAHDYFMPQQMVQQPNQAMHRGTILATHPQVQAQVQFTAPTEVRRVWSHNPYTM